MIAILEDDKNIRELVLYTLRNSNFEAVGYSKSSELYEGLKNFMPELLLLDIMLPEEDGLKVLQKLRNNSDTTKLPIIMLTAKDTEYDKIVGLDSGADDYITKPFSMLELVSRIKAMLRRTDNTKEKSVYTFKNLTLDDESHTVWLCDAKLDLSLKEYKILKLLLKKQGKVFSRDEILHAVWNYDFMGESRTLDVHIRSLRSKLASYNDYIKTVRGVGYMIGGKDD